VLWSYFLLANYGTSLCQRLHFKVIFGLSIDFASRVVTVLEGLKRHCSHETSAPLTNPAVALQTRMSTKPPVWNATSSRSKKGRFEAKPKEQILASGQNLGRTSTTV